MLPRQVDCHIVVFQCQLHGEIIRKRGLNLKICSVVRKLQIKFKKEEDLCEHVEGIILMWYT